MAFRDDDPESFLPALMENGAVIVEIGCGEGRYCRHLADYSSMLYCVDIDSDALRKTEQLLAHLGKTKFRAITSTSGIADSTVDLVLFANSFHDISEKARMESEASRILKKSGKIIVVDWKKGSRTSFGPPQSIRMSEDEYMEYFHDFKIRKRFSAGSHHFGLVLSRKL